MKDCIPYSAEKMDGVKDKVQRLIGIVNELEEDFPGRHGCLNGTSGPTVQKLRVMRCEHGR